jgi:hypothetical protein
MQVSAKVENKEIIDQLLAMKVVVLIWVQSFSIFERYFCDWRVLARP